MKELFIKKLHICTKTYDYNDETKDVKGKVSASDNALERENQRHFRVARASSGVEVSDELDHPQLGRGDVDDREEHLQTSPQRKEGRTRLLRDWNRAGGRGRSFVASPPRDLRVLPVADHQRSLRREEPQGLCYAFLRLGIPRALRLRGECRARLPQEHLT